MLCFYGDAGVHRVLILANTISMCDDSINFQDFSQLVHSERTLGLRIECPAILYKYAAAKQLVLRHVIGWFKVANTVLKKLGLPALGLYITIREFQDLFYLQSIFTLMLRVRKIVLWFQAYFEIDLQPKNHRVLCHVRRGWYSNRIRRFK